MTTSAPPSKHPAVSGTWDAETGEAVNWADALRAWSIAATPILIDTAKTYNKIITYKELGEGVRAASGINTSKLLQNWIGKVLSRVALDLHAQGGLMLTALCVHQDGTVGYGFAVAAAPFLGGVKPDDPELYAADVRLRCYQKYATDLPAGGGTPRLTPQESSRRAKAAPPPEPKLCPVHYTVLPSSGQCDDCA